MEEDKTKTPPKCRGRIQIIPIQERPAWIVLNGDPTTEPSGPFPVVAMTVAVTEFEWEGEWHSAETVDVNYKPTGTRVYPIDPVGFDWGADALGLWSEFGFLVLWPDSRREPWVPHSCVYFTEEAAREAIQEMAAERLKVGVEAANLGRSDEQIH
jgi:hypothetical protein